MFDISKFKDLFVSEAEDHLQRMNENLLALEKKPEEKQLLDRLIQSAHTIKGSSAIMRYRKLAFLMHVLEDVFDYARHGTLTMSPAIINELFEALDALGKSLETIKTTGKEQALDAQAERLKDVTGVVTEGTGKSSRTQEGKPARPKSGKKLPPGTSIQDLAVIGKFQMAKATDEPAEPSHKISHIKVPVERLDTLLALVEELLIDKMRLEPLKKKDPKIREVVEHLDRLVADIQYHVMQARLVPLEQVFLRFPRMVRDLAQEQHKEVLFEMTGDKMELDRTIVDKLGEPLIHLLRNAVDHGIEQKGTVRLKATRERELALISVEDNGRGIDFEKVRQAAIERSIAAEEEAASYNERQLLDLLFHPRLSTKKNVTATSGRGIGLSIVKNFVEEIGGRVIVESPLQPSGTRFTLELPLTLAIINALLVESHHTVFAIPFSVVERIIHLFEGDVKSIGDEDMAVTAGSDMPLVWLGRLVGLAAAAQAEHDVLRPSYPFPAVVVRRGSDLVALAVDKLVSEQEIIVKPLPPVLRGIEGFSGSTILGDGKTILILDVTRLMSDPKKFLRVT